GLCGRELCCSSWLGEFQPVSIRMAKDQRLSLNPSKLTGQCGRLKCCLKFENDTYRQIREELPEVGDLVRTTIAGEEAAGRVVEVFVAKESVEVDFGEGRRRLVSLKEMESGQAVVLTGKLARDGAPRRSGSDAASGPEVEEPPGDGTQQRAVGADEHAAAADVGPDGADGFFDPELEQDGGPGIDDGYGDIVSPEAAKDAGPAVSAVASDGPADRSDGNEDRRGAPGAGGSPRRRRKRRPRRRPRPEQPTE